MKNEKPLSEQQEKEKLRKKCVDLAKRISKERDDYKCCYCTAGRPERQVHSHHVFHEGLHTSMSADVDNLITLCARHHATGQWNRTRGFNFHATPAEAMEWYKEEYPERYKILLERSRKTQVCDMQYWEKKHNQLKEQI